MKVGIIGTGTLGPSIAQVFSQCAEVETVYLCKGRESSKKDGKTPVTVREAPGFIVNHILIPIINETISIYAEGIVSVEDIDTAMKLGTNHPMGSLALGDLIGLDVVLAILEVMFKETGDPNYKPESMLKRMVREKKLGRKTGEVFYKYS